MSKLTGKSVAVLATHGFEQSELSEPVEAVRKAGALVHIISLDGKPIQGMNHDEKGEMVDANNAVSDVSAQDYDGLILPGGVANPDSLRMSCEAMQFVRDFFSKHKPVAAICHAPWTLIEANVVKNRNVTSFPSIKTDLLNAGALWDDQEVVIDQGLITSRNPDDLPAFCQAIIDEFSKGEQARQTV
ncbi:type 1 glutamine amidotransferase domain-containing protein [Alteromonas halophila]|uniref:Protease n=1 Tax=Alteromonas halophila TaxID=516698 RepID=A0A918N1R3_9ALTE|nr:type 1 glutamine amidotransferase domain-containing protein [Alteromonas halophila]GGW95023.1 protease [Alteromonas halophila]